MHKLHSHFACCPSNALFRPKIESGVLYLAVISSTFIWTVSSFISWTFLKSTGQLLCKMSLCLGLLNVPLRILTFARNSTEGCCILLSALCQETMTDVSFHSLLMMSPRDLVKMMLARFFTEKFVSRLIILIVNNKHFIGR